MESNGKFDLDLTGLVRPLKLKIGNYEGSLLPDIPLATLAGLQRAFSGFGNLAETDLDMLAQDQEHIWQAAETVLSKAVPALPGPAREILTFFAAIKLLTFLLTSFSEAMGVTPPKTVTSGASSVSSDILEEASTSVT